LKILHRGENCHFVPAFSQEIVRESVRDIPSAGAVLHSGIRRGRQTFIFDDPPKIVGRWTVSGKKEGAGPVGQYIHSVYRDPKMGEKNFEMAEIDMLREAVDGAIKAGGYLPEDIDLFIAGDLLNQITTSSYVARELNIPYMGMYSACSTSSESLATAAFLINAGYIETAACATVSHFATAERQYRFPLEYGCQRPPYSQWTVTGAGCALLSKAGKGPAVTAATLGKVVDYGANDIGNMGAAMAPAAMDTLAAHFFETGTTPADYDLILTGDLGKLGSDILRELMRERGYPLLQNYIDCGTLIYASDQDVYQGGSGCGCSATVLNSFILEKMEAGQYKSVLLAATGALMSPQSCYQGETIPCISHAVVIRAGEA
jgi:stage V sporulation protein AD